MRTISFIALSALLVACSDRVEHQDTATSDPSAVATAAGPPPAVTTSGSPAPASAIPSNAVNVRMVDYSFEMPNQIAAGSVTFNVENAGEHKHNFEIEGQGIEKELEEDLEPGQRGTLRVDLQPGRYRVYCPVGDHAEKRGMETTLTVI